MKNNLKCLLFINSLVFFTTLIPNSFAEEIDASDPTKIYTYAGGGVKYTNYTNGSSMTEVRATGNLGLSKKDMMLFELGYGSHSGPPAAGSDTALTNSRIRWFHLFKMDYSVPKGYRGWASQVDLQLAGELKGTNGQNVLAVGGIAAFGLSERWSFFTGANLVNAWNKASNWQGSGVAATALWVYSPEKWWKGAYLQIWPSYTRFMSGANDGQASSNLDLTTGGEIIPNKVLWSVTYQKNLDGNFSPLKTGSGTGLGNDWNVFFNVTRYF